MTPYYDEDGITIYHADCREILGDLTFDVIVTDPPYGIDVPTDYSSIVRTGANAARFDKGRRAKGGKAHTKVIGDTEPFDPALLLDWPCALFGVNHYAQRLPEGCTWHIWDKRDGLGSNMMADAEMWATTWQSGPTRIFRYKWLGYMRPSGSDDGYDHPTAKPLALMRHIIAEKRTPEGTILDPFMGSGTTLRAAKDLGRKAIGVEIEERYCEIAVQRLAQQTLELGI